MLSTSTTVDTDEEEAFVCIMTKKKKGTNLKDVVPTAAEYESARKKREMMDQKAKASINASARHFVKQHEDQNPSTLGNRQHVADEVIDSWLVWLARCQDGEKTVKNERHFQKTNAKFADLHWYGKEMLGTTFGTNRAMFLARRKASPAPP